MILAARLEDIAPLRADEAAVRVDRFDVEIPDKKSGLGAQLRRTGRRDRRRGEGSGQKAQHDEDPHDTPAFLESETNQMRGPGFAQHPIFPL